MPPRLLPAMLALLVMAASGAVAVSRPGGAAAAGTPMGYCQVPTWYTGESSSLAFAGQDLVYANPNSGSLYRFRPWEPCPQPGAGVPLQGQTNTYALAYDGSRQVLWALAVNGSDSSVYTIDLAGGPPVPRFDLGGVGANGLAYDASNDSLWATQFGHVIAHYTTAGAFLDSCYVQFPPHGLMVAGNQVYVSGDFEIHVVDRASCTGGGMGVDIESWSTNAFEGDLECDPVTFAGQEVFWSKERVGNAVTAWTANPGTCPPGSGYTVPPTATPIAPTNTPLPTATKTPFVAPTDTPISENEQEQPAPTAPPAPQAEVPPPGDAQQPAGITAPQVRLPNTGQPDTRGSDTAQLVLVILVLGTVAGSAACWAFRRRT